MLSVEFLKASSYEMTVLNSKKMPSYFYSLEQESVKSVYHAMFFGNEPPHIYKPGVCHGDDLMYIFNFELPIALCDSSKTVGKPRVRYFHITSDILYAQACLPEAITRNLIKCALKPGQSEEVVEYVKNIQLSTGKNPTWKDIENIINIVSMAVVSIY